MHMGKKVVLFQFHGKAKDIMPALKEAEKKGLFIDSEDDSFFIDLEVKAGIIENDDNHSTVQV